MINISRYTYKKDSEDEAWESWKVFLSFIGVVVMTGGFIFTIFSSNLNEAQKYFATTALFMLYIIGYIKFVVEKKVKA